MALVEAVFGEFHHQVKNLRRDLFADTFGLGTLHELFPIANDDIHLLFPHGFAEIVGFGHLESRHRRGDEHNLLLIDDNAVSIF